VWRQSIRNQKAKLDHRNIATLSWDLRKFYERVSHCKLRERAERHGFPLALIDVAINAYKMARIITYDGLAADELFPDCGIVAGDSLSDALVKVYYLDVFDEVTTECTDAAIQVYFDDLQATCIGTPDDIVQNLQKFAESMHTKIVEDLEASLALDKAAVTADNEDLCRRLRDALGEVAGPPTSLAAFLGIDELNGRRRSCIAKDPASKWKARQKAANDRRPRLARLADGRIAGAARIFTSGILPQASHGVEVIGMSNAELEALRKTALVAIPPKGKARSLSALMVAKGDPIWRPATAPLARWAHEIWLSTAPRDSAVDAIPLKELEDVWQAARSGWPKSWNHSRGALDAAVLSARRINWRFIDFQTVKTDLDVSIKFTDITPKLLNRMLRDAVQRSWQRKLAMKLTKDGFTSPRVCPDPIRITLASTWGRKSPWRPLPLSRPSAAVCGQRKEHGLRGMCWTTRTSCAHSAMRPRTPSNTVSCTARPETMCVTATRGHIGPCGLAAGQILSFVSGVSFPTPLRVSSCHLRRAACGSKGTMESSTSRALRKGWAAIGDFGTGRRPDTPSKNSDVPRGRWPSLTPTATSKR